MYINIKNNLIKRGSSQKILCKNDDCFITQWDTTLQDGHASANNQLVIPFRSSVGGIQNDCTVYWGDGTSEKVTGYLHDGLLHTYSKPGTYNVRIDGTCYIQCAGILPRDSIKLKKILQWGKNVWLTGYASFAHTFNMTEIKPLGAPNIHPNSNMGLTFYNSRIFTSIDMSNWKFDSTITNVHSMFEICYHLKHVKLFNTHYITNMKNMFKNANSFNCDLSSMDISNVTDMTDFIVCPPNTYSRENYDKLLIAFANGPHKPNVPLRVTAKYTIGGAAEAARTQLINEGWTITDNGGI